MKGIKPRSKRKNMKFKHKQKLVEFHKRRFYLKKKKRSQIDFVTTLVSGVNVIHKIQIASKRETQSYTDSHMVIATGFRELYPEIKNIPTIKELLEGIPRQLLIKLAQTLANIYKEKGIKSFQRFFSSTNSALRDDFNNRFQKIYKRNYEDIVNGNKEYIFCTMQTITELLKQGFSITHKNKNLSNNDFEENVLKAILIINDSLNDYKYEQKSNDKLINLAELLLVNSFSQKDINNFDYNVTFREMFTKSIDLFEYISTNEYFKPIYERFKEKLQINDYRDYIKTILTLFIIILQNAIQSKRDTQIEQWAGKFEYDSDKDEDKLINTGVLDFISVPWDSLVTVNENDDYKIFRGKPLIKFPDGSYEIVNVGFLLERLYYSLYFDFKSIVEELGLDLSTFNNEYKEGFGEKHLLCKYIEKINDSNKYIGIGSEIGRVKENKNDDGEPDYYLRKNNDTVILFENKSILINGKIKQSRDFNKIIGAYKNKLLLKSSSNEKVKSTPSPIGIGQLVEQIKKIQNQKAFWDKTVSTESTIYPVIVLDDSKLLPDGLAFLMQRWYEDLTKVNGIDNKNIRPLILMSISTLLLYGNEFRQKGFEYYFEKYYESIHVAMKNQKGKPMTNIINATITFTEFMSLNFPKNYDDIFESYKNKLFTVDDKEDEKETPNR